MHTKLSTTGQSTDTPISIGFPKYYIPQDKSQKGQLSLTDTLRDRQLHVTLERRDDLR